MSAADRFEEAFNDLDPDERTVGKIEELIAEFWPEGRTVTFDDGTEVSWQLSPASSPAPSSASSPASSSASSRAPATPAPPTDDDRRAAVLAELEDADYADLGRAGLERILAKADASLAATRSGSTVQNPPEEEPGRWISKPSHHVREPMAPPDLRPQVPEGATAQAREKMIRARDQMEREGRVTFQAEVDQRNATARDGFGGVKTAIYDFRDLAEIAEKHGVNPW